MLQNAKVTTFTIFELLREHQQGWGGDKITPDPLPTLGLRKYPKNMMEQKIL